MRHQVRVGLAQGVVAITAPAVVGRIVHHGGPYGIEFDVALATEQIGLGLDQRGSVAAAPQDTGAAVGGDVLHLTSSQGDDEPWDGFRTVRRNKEVYVVGHDGIGV